MADTAIINVIDSTTPILRAFDIAWVSTIISLVRTFAFPLLLWFKPLVVIAAMSWLMFRAYQVINKPLDELATLLGFDIPSTPVVDLASIKADGVIIHWSLPEKQRHKSSLKYEIFLNGMPIDTLPIHETAATVTGLRPSSSYVIRVSLANNVDFSSKSNPIRFRTKPAATLDFFAYGTDNADADHQGFSTGLPRVQPYRGLKDISNAIHNTVLNPRDVVSGSVGPKKSLVGGRRPSRVALGLDKSDGNPDTIDNSEGAESIQRLTEKLDSIRRETDELERQAKEEDEEELRQKEELMKERDDLRAEAAEREKASRNLKKDVWAMERHNTIAQNERSKQDRILQQKKQDREKLQDDMVRWDSEAKEMNLAVERMREEKAAFLEQADKEKEILRAKQAEEAASIKVLDEAVKEKNAEIKKLERSMKSSSPNGHEVEPNLVQQMQQDNEEKRMWDLHMANLQQQYAVSAQKLEQAKQFYASQMNYIETMRARRRQEEAARYASPPPTNDRPLRESPRDHRTHSGHSSSESPRLANFSTTTNSFAAPLLVAREDRVERMDRRSASITFSGELRCRFC